MQTEIRCILGFTIPIILPASFSMHGTPDLVHYSVMTFLGGISGRAFSSYIDKTNLERATRFAALHTAIALQRDLLMEAANDLTLRAELAEKGINYSDLE